MPVNAREAAELLGVSERTIRRWIERGVLPATKAKTGFLIADHALDALRPRIRAGTPLQAELELAELRGRYLELRERVADLEALLKAGERQAA